jgi:hypothetical protein
MSKQNNVNPGNYYEGDRNHQGEGIVHEDHKDRLNQDRARQQQGKEGDANFIPGAKPVGQSDDDK